MRGNGLEARKICEVCWIETMDGWMDSVYDTLIVINVNESRASTVDFLAILLPLVVPLQLGKLCLPVASINIICAISSSICYR